MTKAPLAPAILWRKAQPGLWVATSDDARPLGIVTQKRTHGFVVTSRSGRDLGTFADLDAAERALESSL
ncbi:hypothetical protein [Herbiconiux sp. YIM B11900]|uniref:hypothetical protein n=1 Tax=Herbiconiux sp. YIM B11900 TaxID=3404131 RepID=UPI003F82EB04